MFHSMLSSSKSINIYKGPIYVLMEYDHWEDERYDLQFDLFKRDVSMSLSSKELLTHHDTTKLVARFIVRTSLLGQFYKVDNTVMGIEALKEDLEDAERAGSVSSLWPARERRE